MAPRFDIIGGDRNYRWVLFAENGVELIRSFHIFTTKHSAIRSAKAVMEIAPTSEIEAVFEMPDTLAVPSTKEGKEVYNFMEELGNKLINSGDW